MTAWFRRARSRRRARRGNPRAPRDGDPRSRGARRAARAGRGRRAARARQRRHDPGGHARDVGRDVAGAAARRTCATACGSSAGTRGSRAVAVLSLALGIGANTAIFQVINAVRLRTLPVPNPSELAEIRLVDPSGMRGSFHSWNPTLTNPIWEQIRARQQGFSRCWRPAPLPSTSPPAASRGRRRPSGSAARCSARSACGRQPAALLTDADDRRGCPARAVLSYPFWQREYGGDRSARRAHADAAGAAGRDRRRRAGGILRARGRPLVRRGAADLRPADPRRRPAASSTPAPTGG